jgi:hypothetical protein
MFSTRRSFLSSLSALVIARELFGAIVSGQEAQSCNRHYNVTATVTLLSVPLVSRAGVGSGYITIEDSADGSAAIQFGAGSWPEKARGLNRLGYIKEIVAEKAPGEPSQCEYFAFMTSSQERNLEQAKKAITPSATGIGANNTIPYAAVEANGREGRFHSKLVRFALPSSYSWRDTDQLIGKVRGEIATAVSPEFTERSLPEGEGAPATFLYAVRRSILDPDSRSERSLTYNGKQYLLRTHKRRDASLGAHVMRLDAMLRNDLTGNTTPFTVWFEEGAERQPPLRFEYQARSFLRLTFDSEPAVPAFSPTSLSAINIPKAFVPGK